MKKLLLTVSLAFMLGLASTASFAAANKTGTGSRWDGISYTERNTGTETRAMEQRRLKMQRHQRIQAERQRQALIERQREMQRIQEQRRHELSQRQRQSHQHRHSRQNQSGVHIHVYNQPPRSNHHRTQVNRYHTTTVTRPSTRNTQRRDVSARDLGYALGVLGGAAILHNAIY